MSEIERVARRAACCCVALWFAAGCGSESPPKGKPEAPAEGDTTLDRVQLAADVAKEAGVVVAPAVRATLPVTVALTGEVAADPDRTADVPARVSGRMVSVQFKEGDRVAAGQVLAIVESGGGIL